MTLDRPLSAEEDVLTYNNFYEFGSHKSISAAAQALRIRPWQVRLDGMVEKEQTIGGTMAQLNKTFPTMDCSI